MEITIKCDSLKELNDVIEQMVILFPEKKTKGRKKDPETADLIGKYREIVEKPEGSHRENTAAPEKQKKKRQKVDRDKILTLHREGKSARTIANLTGYGYSTVCMIISGTYMKKA